MGSSGSAGDRTARAAGIARLELLAREKASLMREAAEDSAPRGSIVGRWARMLVLAIGTALAVHYVRRHPEAFRAYDFRWWYLALLGTVECGLLALRGVLTQRLCRIFAVEVPFKDAVRLAAWTNLANYVTPFVGGSGVRAVYLKRRHGLPYAEFVSLQAATYLLHFLVASLAALASLPFLHEITPRNRLLFSALYISVALGVLAILLLPVRLPTSPSAVGRYLKRAVQGWMRFRRSDWRSLVGLLVLNTLAQAAGVGLAFAALGVSLDAGQMIFVAAFYSLSILVAVTPASLGISEGAVVLSAAATGVAAAFGLAAAGLRRGVSLTAAILLGVLGGKPRS